ASRTLWAGVGVAESAATCWIACGDDRGGVVAPRDEREYVLALVGGRDLAAELVGEQLHAVADAKDRQFLLEYPGRNHRCLDVVDARGSAGQDDAARPQLRDLVPWRVVRHQLAIHVTLANAARDQHRILRAEVDDDHRFGWCGDVWRRCRRRFAALLSRYFE